MRGKASYAKCEKFTNATPDSQRRVVKWVVIGLLQRHKRRHDLERELATAKAKPARLQSIPRRIVRKGWQGL
jgi:hypothetical protein